MSQHTPGPWEIVAEDGHGCTIYAPAAGDVADAYWLDGEGKANALLIAAAPDLLEACRAVQVLTTGDARRRIDAAIEKAEGKP